jgi:hypothetical protein
MKTLDKLLTSILAVTLVFSVLSVANPYYFVVGPSAYAENDDEEKSNSEHGSNNAHDSDKEEHEDDDECKPEDDVDEEVEDEEVNKDETSNEEEENDDGSESDEAEEDEESSSDVNDEEEVDEQEEESDEEENEVEDESEQEEGDSEDAAEDAHNEGQETEEQEAEDETEDEQNDLEEVDEDECNNEGQVTEEEIKEKHKERIQDIVITTSGTQIHERHMNAEPMSVGEYAPGLAYSLTAAGVAEHGGVHTVEVDMDIAVWKSNSAIVLMDVLGGTVTVEGHAYTVAIGYGLYSTHSDMMRVSALVVDEGTGDVFKLKLRGNAIGEDVQLPMNADESLNLSFEGNSGPSKNEFDGAELDLEGAITAA